MMASSTSQPASNMVPKYEVKLLMDPTNVLDSNKRLKPTVLETFTAAPPVVKMAIQFLDTNTKDIYNKDWSPRIRKVQGKADFELTYKRRYTIANGEIDATLAIAAEDGFDLATTIYEAQVDLGYEKQTLSINRDEFHPSSGYDAMDLPGEEHSRIMLTEHAPEKFDNWVKKQWITDKLKESRIYGPVLAQRYVGEWGGEKVYIEMWPVKAAIGTGTEYIVEASFKVRKRTKAFKMRQELMDLLCTKGWFLARDFLRTSAIMERY